MRWLEDPQLPEAWPALTEGTHAGRSDAARLA